MKVYRVRMGSFHRHLNYYQFKFLLISTGTQVWRVGFCFCLVFFTFFDKALSLSYVQSVI